MHLQNKKLNRKRYHSGTREDLGAYVRSKWEANYFRFLKYLVEHRKIKSFEYEPTTFWFENIKRGCRFYTPDFLVEENDGSVTYHEVKGFMDQKSQTKLKRMAIYYPTIKIFLIVRKDLQEIEKKLGRLISHWEY